MLGKHTLNPKEKTDLKVTFETAGRPGPFQKKVIFITSIPGFENIEIFAIRGMVKEAPSAKILVEPRKILLAQNELSTGKNQIISITNQGSIPLTISRIHSKDGNTVYFDGIKQGEMVIEPNQTKTIELNLIINSRRDVAQDYIIIDSNAKNAGKSGYYLAIQYGGEAK